MQNANKRKRDKLERLSTLVLGRLTLCNHQRTLRLHPRKMGFNRRHRRLPNHDLDLEPKVIPSHSVHIQVLVNHLPPGAPHFGNISPSVELEVEPPLRQQEGKFRKVGRRNRCESLVKKRREYVKLYRVHRKRKPSEDPVASQVDAENVAGRFPKPSLWGID